jgi:hypothetical protein
MEHEIVKLLFERSLESLPVSLRFAHGHGWVLRG